MSDGKYLETIWVCPTCKESRGTECNGPRKCKICDSEPIAVSLYSGHPQTSDNSDYATMLENIIFWALGENGDFPIRKKGEGAYYWRKELRKRFDAAKQFK
ncbi:MAG: hypothetical protein ACFFDN_01985 [Candidatus Hodarchaeota archaeon]